MFRSFQKSVFKAASTGILVVGAFEVTTHLPSQGRSAEVYHTISDEYLTPLIRRVFNPEDAHNLALFLLKHQFAPRFRPNALESSSQVHLHVTLNLHRSSTNPKGQTTPSFIFPNCIGLAAGFDKDGTSIQGLMDIGFGFVEMGSVTPKPQPGNPKPRMFRLVEDYGVMNRFGFNSLGVDKALEHVIAFRQLQQSCNGPRKEDAGTRQQEEGDDDGGANSWKKGFEKITQLVQKGCKDLLAYYSKEESIPPPLPLLGINLGKNKLSEHETEDYVTGISKLGIYADYITINISSPNTPGLRNLQKKEPIRRLFQAVLQARDSLPPHPHPSSSSSRQHVKEDTTITTRNGVDIPIFVKISPDCSDEELDDIASAVMEFGIDGILISNTTNQRPTTLQSIHKNETGGLSGRPLKHLSTECIRKMYQKTQGRVFIIGIGGVESGRDAYEKIKAGASVIQLYSAMVYQGAGLISRIRRELAEIMLENGYRTIDDVVGLDHEDIYLKRQVCKIQQLKGA